MTEKVLNTRMQQKHGSQSDWEKATNFIPKQGEIIVYDADATCQFPRIKIGNASSTVGALEFLYEPVTTADIEEICV